MATIKPFRAMYFDVEKVGDIRNVVSPPHDVISDEARNKLYAKSDYNIVRVIFPKEGDLESAKTLKKLDSEGVLKTDEKEAFYVYEQEFEYVGKKHKRSGFLTLVRATPLGMDVLPHEQVFPEKVEDRIRIQQAAKVDTSPIMAVYDDDEAKVKQFIKSAKDKEPLFEFSDESGVINRIWPLYDTEKIVELLKDKNIIIADGHHRYTAASRMAENGGPKYAFVYLMDINDPAMIVLPTHRFLDDSDFELPSFLDKASKYFEIKEVSDIHELEEQINSSEKHTFGIHTKEKSYLLKLKDPKLIDNFVNGSESETLKHLETTILNKIILETICGLDCDCASFAKHKDDVIRLIDSGKSTAAFLLRHSGVSEVAKIAENKERMPKKSTYFYPKPMAGVILCRAE